MTTDFREQPRRRQPGSHFIGSCLSLLLTLAATSLLVSACRTQVSDDYLEWARRSYAEVPEVRLGAGDELELRIYPDRTLSGEYVVPPGGAINHPLIGLLQVANRTCFEIEQDVTTRLADGLYRSPAVTCQITKLQSAAVTMIGSFSTTGAFAYREGLTAIDALAAAGGFTAGAGRDRVQLTRVIDGVQYEIVIPLQSVLKGRAPNFLLWPDDLLYAPGQGAFD